MYAKKEKAVYYKQLFGKNCSSIIGYNDKNLEFISNNSQDQPSTPLANPKLQILGIKQIENRENILADILDVLNLSPREMVDFVFL